MLKKIKTFLLEPGYQLVLGKNCKNLLFFLLVALPNLIAAMLEGVSFGFIFLAFSTLNTQGSLPSSLHYLSYLGIASWFTGRSNQELFFIILFMAILLQVFRSLCAFCSTQGVNTLSLKTQAKGQRQVYHQILRFSFATFNRYKIGDLIQAVNSPINCIHPIISSFNHVILQSSLTLVYLGLMLKLSPPLTLASIVFFTAIFFSQKIIFKKIRKAASAKLNEAIECANDVAQSFQGIRVIHIYNQQDAFLRQTGKTLAKMLAAEKKNVFWSDLTKSLSELGSIVVVAGLLVIAIFLFSSHSLLSIPTLIAFLCICYRLTNVQQQLLLHIIAITQNIPHLKLLNTILKKEDKEFLPEGGNSFSTFTSNIFLNNVSFAYPSSEKHVLQNLHFSIPKGKMTAIVGMSGAGKSSLLDLLARLYSPTKGKILIDNVDLTEYNLEEWRKILGVVSQECFIFNDTIRRNILFGTEAGEEKMQEAAKISGCFAFIEKLPKQFDTSLGERGYRLSGGEKQRIALARAILRDPEILILDEATSSLDSYSENLIKKGIDQFRNKKTLIVVAHRLSTIANADQIMVINQGSVVEQGSHDDLIMQKGHYCYLWQLQALKETTSPESALEV